MTIKQQNQLNNKLGSNAARKIEPKEAREMMQKENDVLFDVRSANEFKSGHIEGAQLFPVDEINEATASKLIPDKSTGVIVYCRRGIRSAVAAQMLVDLGYQNVYDFGGLQDWPYEVKQGA